MTVPNPLAPAAGMQPMSPMSSLPDWGPRPEGVASSNPDAFSKGGLLDQAQLEFVSALFTLQGPPTYTAPGQVFLYAKLRDLSDGQTLHDAWWTCGKQEDVLPSQDGAYLMKNPASGKDLAVQESTNYALLVKSLADKGYPKNLLDCGNVHKIFTDPQRGGLMIKSIRFQPEGRNNMKNAKPKANAQGQERDPIGVLIAENILKFPWEAAPHVAIASRPQQHQAQQPMPPQQQQYAPPQNQPMAPAPMQQQQQPQYAQPMPPQAPTGMPAPFAPNMAPNPMAPAPPQMAPPQMAAQPAAPVGAAPGLPTVTDPNQMAVIIRDTLMNVIAQQPGGILPEQQIKVQVFRALQNSYEANTVNQLAAAADNIQWLTSVGFVHDPAAKTIRRA